MREKRQTTLMAQKAEGGPVKEKVLKRREPKPPMQPEEAPKWSKKYSYTVGPWTLTDLETLEDAEQRFKKEFINPENVEVLEMILIRNSTADRELEYEYARDARGVWHRVMERKRRPLNGKEV